MKNNFFNFLENSPPYFIADIAANHDGSIDRAKELIWLAKESGAHCAKFQHYTAKNIINGLGFETLNPLKTHQSDWDKSVTEIYDQYHFKREWTKEIANECRQAKIDFSSTPYDHEAIDLIKGYVPFIKIGSGDISWIEHIEDCLTTGLPIVIASGASMEADVIRAMKLFEKNKNQVCLMQCNTNYTIESDKIGYVNLNVLKKYKQRYPSAILGLSDHTLTDTSVLGAIALGAKVIEKHFTDDNDRVGPDHKFAINPRNWRLMVNRANELSLALGDGNKKVEANEFDSFIVQRRSCTAMHVIEKGAVLTKGDLTYLRPCPEGAFHPYEAKKIIGRKVNRTILEGEIFYNSDFND
jgi:sialic acid synthase SpsE